MKGIERRGLVQARAGVKVDTRSDSGKRYVEGYAAVFYDPNDPEGTEFELWPGFRERIMPGAFDRALKEDDIRCLFNHDSGAVLGRNRSKTLELWVDSIGLGYRCWLAETTWGNNTFISIERGDISGSSFGFELRSEESERIVRGTDVVTRELLDVSVYDVSPVTYPAYLGTDVTILKRSLEARAAETLKLKKEIPALLAARRARRMRMLDLA